MIHLTEITVNGKTYAVSQPLADSIEDLARESSRLTAFCWPGAGVPIELFMTEVGRNPIYVIKELRALRGITLREAKDMLDTLRDGQVPRLSLGKFLLDVATDVAATFRDAGATIDFPGPLELLAREAV